MNYNARGIKFSPRLSVNAEGTVELSASIGVLIEQAASGAIVGTNGDGVNDIGERNVFGWGSSHLAICEERRRALWERGESSEVR